MNYYLGDAARLIETPGHSHDSISIILEDKIVFLGDTLVSTIGPKYPPFADEEILLKKTWKELLKTKAKLFCPAHGRPFGRVAFIKIYQKEVISWEKN
ncbi:MAG: hypothetical protein GX235_00830 [Clostridiales bacterium]|nr:hypothetical protein [Clostridiales bacterium]